MILIDAVRCPKLRRRKLEAVLRDLIARIVFIAPPFRAASSQSHS
jgi:hypothetical protein